jgi:pantetheine-phosphate adenylyltransferase
MQRIAVFPGSFDPLTRGHQSIILRALPLFDQIIIGLGDNSGKDGYFPVEKRIEWLTTVFRDEPKIKVMKYKGLTVDFCRTIGAGFILRGLRTSADFEFERSIGLMNKSLNPLVETLFLLSNPELAAISSSVVRDIIRNGGDVAQFIPEGISIP